MGVQVPVAGEAILGGGGTERDWEVDELGCSGNIGYINPRRKKRGKGIFKKNRNIRKWGEWRWMRQSQRECLEGT